MTREAWDMSKQMVYVHFRAGKSRQNQQDETDLTTEHYGNKCGVNGERGGKEASERLESWDGEGSVHNRREASQHHG